MGTDPEPLSLVWQRGFFFWVCVGVWPPSPRTRLEGREGWWNIKALTIRSFQVLFPAAALRLASLQHPVTQASLTTVAAWCDPPGGGQRSANRGREELKGREGMLCPETSHNNNTVFIYVLTRRRVEEEVGNKASGISVKVQRGDRGGVSAAKNKMWPQIYARQSYCCVMTWAWQSASVCGSSL